MPEKKVAYVGVDLHQKSVTMAVHIEKEEEPREVIKLPNEKKALKRFFDRWNERNTIKACYEAGSSGYGFYRWMRGQGYECDVIAPSLVPKKPGEKKKTDVRDAKQLAKSYRNGDLTKVRVPSEEEEIDRSVVRARHTLKRQEKRIKQVILKYVQIGGYYYSGGKNWTERHRKWLKVLEMETRQRYVMDIYLAEMEGLEQYIKELDGKIAEMSKEARYAERVKKLKAFRGIETLTAMTLITEVVDFKRFGEAKKLMSYIGLVPGEDSSGERERKTSITKTGNSECRRVLVEAAHHARYAPIASKELKARQEGQPPLVIQRARKAMKRLHDKYWKVMFKRGANKAKVAVARELAGFIWAMMQDAA